MTKSEALKILGLSDGATDDDIKAAHRSLVRANHPDKFAGNETKKAAAEDKMKSINEARDVLLNKSWKPEYANGPRAYNPYAGYGGATRSGGGSSYGGYGSGQGDPFEGIPFDFDFIWTNMGQQGSTQGGQRYTYSGFNPFDPFGAYTQRKPKTPEEQLEEATEDLKSASITVAVKLFFAILLLIAGPFILGIFSVIIGFFLLISAAGDIMKWRLYWNRYKSARATVKEAASS